MRRGLLLLVGIALAGCAQPPPPFPPAPRDVRRLAVEQPANRTGKDLMVDGRGLVQRLLELETATVADLLAEDLRIVLTRQDFRVVTTGTEGVPVLRTEILRWEPYAADYETVTVDVVATLVEPDSGRELWKAARSNWVVATQDAHSLRDASARASRAVAEALLEGWQPDAAPQTR